MSADELERLIHHMPAVAERATNTWAAGFARSIHRQAKRRNWKPSRKQVEVMRRLVRDLFAHDGFDGELIE